MVRSRDLHGITDRGTTQARIETSGKNRGNGERVLTFTALAVVMGTVGYLEINIDYRGKSGNGDNMLCVGREWRGGGVISCPHAALYFKVTHNLRPHII